jgi:site-specific recombinase XerD
VLREWKHALRAEHRSDATVRSYTESARMLVDFLNGAEALDASTDDLHRFIAHLLEHRSPSTAAVRYRSLQQFYGWRASCVEVRCPRDVEHRRDSRPLTSRDAR